MKNQIKKIVLLILSLFLCITFVSCKEDDEVTDSCASPPIVIEVEMEKKKYSKDEDYTFVLKYGHNGYNDIYGESDRDLSKEICELQVYNATHEYKIYNSSVLEKYNTPHTILRIRSFYSSENQLGYDYSEEKGYYTNFRCEQEQKLTIPKELIMEEEGTLYFEFTNYIVDDNDDVVGCESGSNRVSINYKVSKKTVKFTDCDEIIPSEYEMP